MKRIRLILKTVLIIIIIIVLISLFWTAAYFISKAIYSRFDWHPQELVRQILTSLLGLVLWGIVMSLANLKRKQQNTLWQDVINAINRIAKGDFHVNLNGWNERHHPFTELVDGINDMAANLRAMEEMRQEFISNVSHEIGTPLTSIRGFARALKNKNLSHEQRVHYLDIIETECVRLSKLSDNLLRLAMLDSDQYPFHPVSYRLDKQIQSVVLRFEPQWSEKELNMCIMLEKIIITADQDLMSQVWWNLIDNAIKFTPKEGTIKIELKRHKDKAVITVSDTGPGIAEHDQPRIFERFYKADKSRNRSVAGSGLGLSIVKKIIDIHQGEISVRSQSGDGAEFTVKLPLHSDDDK